MHRRPLREWRWWQRLVFDRAFEIDTQGELIWQTVIVSAPRQVGKSFLERAVCAWRMSHGDRFDGPQDVMHVAHKITAAQEVWAPAARWALGEQTDDDASVRWANGQQKIELGDGSRWMIQAATDGAGVAFSLSMVLVDEAWRVHRHVVDAALMPTMAESDQPQLWLVSTAGTSASDLMIAYRNAALARIDEPLPDDSTLLIEWSAPPDPELDIDDPAVWEAATPHWDSRRVQRVRKARDQPEVEFRQQWLNQWIPTLTSPLFDPSVWPSMLWLGALPGGALSFGVDLAADRSHATIVALCSGVAEVVEHRAGASWVAPRLVELTDKWTPTAIGVDGTGPAASVADALKQVPALGDKLVILTGRALSSACGDVYDRITEGKLGVRGHAAMEDAVLHASKRSYGQAWVFARDRDGHSCVPLLALTVAIYASEHATAEVERSRIW